MKDLLIEAYDHLAAELVMQHERRHQDRAVYERIVSEMVARLDASQRRFRRALWMIAAEGFVIAALAAALIVRGGAL